MQVSKTTWLVKLKVHLLVKVETVVVLSAAALLTLGVGYGCPSHT